MFAQVGGDVGVITRFEGDADHAVAVACETVDGGRGVAAVDAPVAPDVEQGRAVVVEAEGFAVAAGERGQVGDGDAVRCAVPVKRQDGSEDDEQVQQDAAQGAPQAARGGCSRSWGVFGVVAAACHALQDFFATILVDGGHQDVSGDEQEQQLGGAAVPKIAEAGRRVFGAAVMTGGGVADEGDGRHGEHE